MITQSEHRDTPSLPKGALEEARLFLEELAENPPHLPYEPALLPMLFAATRDDSTVTTKDIATLIESSQNLAARVLALANSAVYALESTVTSLPRALSILGLREVRTLVVMVAAVSAVKGVRLPKSFDAIGLWRHQLKTASVAKALATFLKQEAADKNDAISDIPQMAPDEAYVAGLLHDIGKVFLAASRPDLWDAIEEIRQISSLSFAEAEYNYWGMDHALIGAQVLHYWKLPLLLTDPISWHHAPLQAPSFQREACLLAAANLTAHSGLDAEGMVHAQVRALLPATIDHGALGEVLKASLDHAINDTFIGLLK